MGLFKKKEDKKENVVSAEVQNIGLTDSAGKAVKQDDVDPNVSAISKLVNQKAAVHYEELSLLVVLLQKVTWIEETLKKELEE